MAATSCPDDAGLADLFQDFLRILREERAFERSTRSPVVRFLAPEKLQEELSLDPTEEAASREEIEAAIRRTLRYSVRTSALHFHNQLYGGVDEYGLLGSWLTDLLNTSQYTYEVAPVFVVTERRMIERCLELVGYPPAPRADGLFCPGGSLSNMYGITLARFDKFPSVKRTGLAGLPTLVCFTSEGGHYSIKKGAHWLGLGTDHVREVRTDDAGRMLPDDLRAAIAEERSRGRVPLLVNATCGTTVLGAFDPLPEIAAVCRQEGLWMHVDACLGGTLLLSEKYRDRLKGIELSDSVAWNPHKMLGAPFQCSVFLVKRENALLEANRANANYLFQSDKPYDVVWDTGDKSVQCGRKVDAFKLWLMWKARGTAGLRDSVDRAMSMAEYFLRGIEAREGFRPLLPRYDCCNVCFWYVPPSMRGQKETADWWKRIYEITAKIKDRAMLEGSLMIGYMPLSHKHLGNFFRMVVTCHPPPTEASMDHVIEQIVEFGADL